MNDNRQYINESWLDPDVPCLYDWYDEFTDDFEMWRTLCAESGGPILDVACATGRVAIELARSGLTVVGLDLSPHMIELARKKLERENEEVRDRASYVVGDMTDFDLGTQFATVVIPAFSFHELTTAEAQEACLRALWRHLRPGGLLLITLGVWTPHANTSPPEEPSVWEKPMYECMNPHTGLYTRQWSLGWGDPDKKLRYHRFYFEELDSSGRMLRHFAVPAPPDWHVRRFLDRDDMESLLEKHGFAVETLYGGLDLKPFDSESRCMIFAARKAD